MVALALTGGIRTEEIFGLSWNDVNFKKSTISIRQVSVYIPGEIITKGPKTDDSARTISLPASTMELLAKHKNEQESTKDDLGEKWIDSDSVFTTWNGKPAHPHSFRTWLNRYTKKHDLSHVSPHKFRHMAATYLLTEGTDIRTVSAKLGHAKPSTTMDLYAHVVQKVEKETATTMENFVIRLQKSSQHEN